MTPMQARITKGNESIKIAAPCPPSGRWTNSHHNGTDIPHINVDAKNNKRKLPNNKLNKNEVRIGYNQKPSCRPKLRIKNITIG